VRARNLADDARRNELSVFRGERPVVSPALLLDRAAEWTAAAAVLLLLMVTLGLRRHRHRLKAKRHDGSEAEREPEGGP
jgi:hypothetical protein